MRVGSRSVTRCAATWATWALCAAFALAHPALAGCHDLFSYDGRNAGDASNPRHDLATADARSEGVTPARDAVGDSDGASLTPTWVATMGSTNGNSDKDPSLAVDADGNVVVTGWVWGPVDFGCDTIVPSVGAHDLFVAQYNPDGTCRRAAIFGGTGDDFGASVALSDSQEIVVTGGFSPAEASLGGALLSSNGLVDIFVAKYGYDGTHRWSRGFGGPEEDQGNDLVVDGSGAIVVTGQFSGSVDFDGKVLTAEGVDIFVAKFDGDDGRCVWARRFGGAQDDRGRAVAVDRDRAIVVTGRFSGEADLGDSGPLVSSGQGDAFVAKYDPNGAHLWSRAFGGTQNDEGRDVAIDAAGSIFLTGSSGGDAFLAKYSSAGAPLFSQTFSGSSTQQGLSLAVDSGQNAVVTGWFSQRADFGGGQLDSAGDSEDVFLARYDDRGTHLWSERFGGIRHDRGQSVAVDGESVLVAGHFDHSATFGDKTVEGNAYDIFVLKLTPP